MAAILSHGLLSIILMLGLCLSVYSADYSHRAWVDTFCVGAGNTNTFYYSIGQDYIKAPDYYSRSFIRTHESVHDGLVAKLSESAHAKLYVIKTGDRYLAGYLAANFWLDKRSSQFRDATFKFLYAQVEDENGFAIGEFLTSPPCTDKKVSPAKVSKFFFTPCAQANPTDNQISNAFTYIWPSKDHGRLGMENMDVRNAITKDLDEKQVDKDLFVFWRLSHTSCNKPKKIRVRAYITTNANIGDAAGTLGRYSQYRSRWLEINWVGAADIVQPHESCELVEIAYSDDETTAAHPVDVPWIKEVSANPRRDNDPVFDQTFCKPIVYGKGVGPNGGNVENPGKPDVIEKIPTFLGRCKDGREGGTVDAAKNTYAHACPDGTKDTTFNFTKYSEYLDIRKSCMTINDCLCQCNDKLVPHELGKKKKPDCRGYIPGSATAPGKTPLFLGFETKSPGGVYILTGRKAHGIAMTLVSMTFVPISIMLSRYFKETYVSLNGATTWQPRGTYGATTWLPRAHLQIIQVWYMAHVMLSFFSICLYLMSWIAMWRSITLLGRSLVWAATWHRFLGLLTIMLFAFIFLIGSLRPVANSPFRIIIMLTHAMLGVLYYFLGLTTVVLSQWIPGSPSANDDECIYSQEFFDKSTYSIMPIVVAWIVVDIIFHILFTVLQCILDKTAGYKRRMLFPLLSILKGGEERSTKGAKLRSLMFIIYCAGNGAITFTIIIKMLISTEAGCGFGPTTCTHSDINTILPNAASNCFLY